jgi:phenylacetate-CoA ligase
VRPFTPRELAINAAKIALHYPAFLRRPFAPREETRAYQLAALRRLVAFAYDAVPLYRDKYRAAGVRPDDLRCLDDLRHFPTVTKAEVVAAYPEGALARGLDLRGCLVSKSSGSTGVVLNVVHRADRLAVQGLALNRLLGLYTRYLPWHRFVYVYTSEYPARSLFGSYPMTLVPTLTPTGEIVNRLYELKPHLLACYPSHLRAIARELGPEGCRRLGLLAVSVSSEPSTQRERDELAAAFGCGVYDEYSTEELTRVAAQCREGTYHLFEDVALVEIVDPTTGAPLPEGGRGEIVGTYLHNYAMPFIRYRQGDLASIGGGACRCGRTFRALAELGGRELDQFVLPSGRVLTSGWLLDASYSFLLDVGADIAAFTLVQETPGRVRVEIVPGRRYGPETSAAIEERFRRLAGEPLEVVVELKSELARSAAGKHNPIVSRVRRAARRCQ